MNFPLESSIRGVLKLPRRAHRGSQLEPTDRSKPADALVGGFREGRFGAQRRCATLMQMGLVSIELADCSDELAPMATLGGTLRRIGIPPLEPRPHTFVVTVGETLGEIPGLFIEAGKKSADRGLISVHYGRRWPARDQQASVAVDIMTVGLAVNGRSLHIKRRWIRKPMQRREV